MARFDNKEVLVTRTGRAIAQAFAVEGARVVLVDSGDATLARIADFRDGV